MSTTVAGRATDTAVNTQRKSGAEHVQSDRATDTAVNTQRKSGAEHVQSESPAPRWADKTASLRRRQQRAQARLQTTNQKQQDKRAMPTNVLPPRAKSTNSKPSKPQTRTLKSNVTGLTHTNSETALADRIKNLSLRNRNGSARSNVSSVSSVQTSSSGNRGYQSLANIVQCIREQRAKNIVVMCGAGISTDSGIPDFRSPGTGLYDNLKQYNIPYPESMFDVDYFEGNPKPFYTLAKELYPIGKYRPNYVHYFLRLLHEKGLLLRVYTQNIDGLERMAGVPVQKLVEAHGTFYTASCIRCDETYHPEMIRRIIYSDKIPRCHKNRCLGLIKPDIVFFGEDMPRRFYYYLKDFPQADLLVVMGTSLEASLLVVMGTSLEVDPFASITDSVRLYVPRVLFNRNAVGPFKKKRRLNDVLAKGDLQSQVQQFVESLGWGEDLETLMRETEERAKTNPMEGSPFGHLDCDESDANGIVTHPSSHPTPNSTRPVIIGGKHSTTADRPKHSRHLTSISARPSVDLISVKTNPTSASSRSNNNRKPVQTTNIKALLPRLSGKNFPAFHAQSKLYRTSNDDKPETGFFTRNALVTNSSEESSDSSESESDDD